MAIDPQFITMQALEDFAAIGGEPRMTPDRRRRLDAVRNAPSIDYTTVRELKHHALSCAFAHFRDTELASGTRRSAAFKAYVREQAWWLDDYALFRALHRRYGERAWTEWPEPMRTRQPAALESARVDLAGDIVFRQYLQWVAGDQWGQARDGAGEVALFGDLPFMVSGDSADVWARQDEFRLDASVGVPPDAFSENGQDWALPVYRWDVLAERDFDWLRNRARRNADLFDGYRVDHLVGFYRTYLPPADTGEPAFVPADEASQLALGEQVLAVFREPGTEIVAEDLGIVPDFVRASLARLDVPGYRVFRWERRWDEDGPAVHRPARLSACVGCHVGHPRYRADGALVGELRRWPNVRPCSTSRRWPNASRRRTVRARARERRLSHVLREALNEVLFASGSRLLILPIQDVFGWRDRINQPATVSDSNWTWRLPWPSDRLHLEAEAIAVADQLKSWVDRYRTVAGVATSCLPLRLPCRQSSPSCLSA